MVNVTIKAEENVEWNDDDDDGWDGRLDFVETFTEGENLTDRCSRFD